MKIKTTLLFFLFAGCLVLSSVAQQSTTVVVRAMAKDAKFIGTSMDGASILIKEAETGKILAEGKTKGSTGDTQRLVREPHKRYGDLHTEASAKFKTHLDLSEPTLVTVSATAPVSQKQSAVTISTQLWLIPGKNITGNGIVLEIPGFAIDILQPQVHERNSSDSITITANAVMMCGCPIEPGGLWDSDEMEFVTVIKKGEKEVARKQMEFAGKQNTFETSFSPQEEGAYQILVYGYDPRTGNTGVDRTTFIKQ
jgi:hypothetical protein